MFMPLTGPEYPNVAWGNTGMPYAYPVALNGLGATKRGMALPSFEWPSLSTTGSAAWTGLTTGATSYLTDPKTIYNTLAFVGVGYLMYSLLVGTKRAAVAAHRKVRRTISYTRKLPGALRAADVAARKAAREAFDAKTGGAQSLRVHGRRI